MKISYIAGNELVPKCQFHQHFYVQIFPSFFYLRFGFGKKFVRAFNVDEIDGSMTSNAAYDYFLVTFVANVVF